MRKFKLFLLTAVAVFSAFVANAQNVTVTGIVSDENGDPIPAAGVVIDGTTKGTITGNDGAYSLYSPPLVSKPRRWPLQARLSLTWY